MIRITKDIQLNPSELKFSFVASPGPGGQNVNKLATAVQLRFDVLRSPSLTEDVRQRLMVLMSSRLTVHGELIIKASQFRTQERNKQDAIGRLIEIIQKASVVPKKRRKTKPTYASKQRRLDSKKRQGIKKKWRQEKES